jgi:hypothetical protein
MNTSILSNNNNQQHNQPNNILFYSEKDKACNLFINICQSNNILKFFKIISIDNKEKEFQMKGLKVVPTIIIKNIGKQFEGKECLEWLDSIIKNKSENLNNTPKINSYDYSIPQQINNNNNNNKNNQNNQNNQFEVPKTNVLKRNKSSIISPPVISNTNVKSRIIKEELEQINKLKIKNANNGPSVTTSNNLFGFLDNEMTGLSDPYAYLLTDNALPKSFLPPDKDLQIYTAPEGDKLDKKKQDMILKNIEFARENDKLSFLDNINKSHKELITKNS